MMSGACGPGSDSGAARSDCAVRRTNLQPKIWPNKPAPGNAGFTLLLPVEHHWPGLPEPTFAMKRHRLLLIAPSDVLAFGGTS